MLPRPRPVDGRRWHVDGFKTGSHSIFDLLVGVCLSDTDTDDSGNLAVHPGAHATVLPLVKRAAATDSIKDLHEKKPDLGGPPVQLRMKVGDVVLAHHKLPHLGVPNHSHKPRLMVYFRVKTRRIPHDVRYAPNSPILDDLFLPFPPLHALNFGVGRRLGPA